MKIQKIDEYFNFKLKKKNVKIMRPKKLGKMSFIF